MFRQFTYSGFLLGVLMLAWVLHFISPVAFSYQIGQIKASQHALMKQAGLKGAVEILLPTADFEKLYDAEEKELRIAGNNFDILSASYTGDFVKCKALFDKEETQAWKAYGDNFSPVKTKQIKYIAYCWQALEPAAKAGYIYWWASVLRHINAYYDVKTFGGYLNALYSPPRQQVSINGTDLF